MTSERSFKTPATLAVPAPAATSQAVPAISDALSYLAIIYLADNLVRQ